MEPITIEDLMERAAKGEGRIVCTNDLLTTQIDEAAAHNRLMTVRDGPCGGCGFVLLPWGLGTKQDFEREGE